MTSKIGTPLLTVDSKEQYDSLKLYIGNTDLNWFNHLSQLEPTPEDINFWRPGGGSFKAISHLSPFLFRLKSPVNKIGGVGFFAQYSQMPISMAWQFFGKRNGNESFIDFRNSILKYRNQRGKVQELDPLIGCIVLTDPIFFDQKDYIDLPNNWNRSIVQGKSYQISESPGKELWERVQTILPAYMDQSRSWKDVVEVNEEVRYGFSHNQKVRLGQGAFRTMVMEKYSRKCAITGEKTLPVLEAAHIKDYSESGPHAVSNGLFLRADLHKLYDAGYLTLTNDFRVEVSARIKEEFNNGKEYYRLQGSEIILPKDDYAKPALQYIEWHQNHKYRG